MNRIWAIVIQELVANFKRRSYLLTALGVPLLAIAIVLGVMLFRGDDAGKPEDPLENLPDLPTGYVDLSGRFPSPGQFALFLKSYEDADAAEAAVLAGAIGSYYLIPADYMQTGQVTRYSQQFNVIESDMGMVESFLVITLLGDDNPLVLARLQSPAAVTEHQLSRTGELVTEIEGDSFDRYWLVYGFAMIMLMSTMMSASQLMRSVIIEKENRMIEVVLSSLRPTQVMIGKVLGQGAAGLIQIVLWLVGIVVIIQITDANIPYLGAVDVPSSFIVIMVLYYLGGYLLFAAFSGGIGAISQNLREGPQYAVVYSIPAVLPLFFITQILDAPNSTLAIVLSFFPLSAPLGMVQRMAITTVPGWQVAVSLVLLFLGVAVALWFSARLFRVNTLLAGQLPSRKELVRLLVRG